MLSSSLMRTGADLVLLEGFELAPERVSAPFHSPDPGSQRPWWIGAILWRAETARQSRLL